MPIELTSLHDTRPERVEVKITGKLHKEDYEEFVPSIEKLVTEHGKLRLLACMRDFHGWDLKAMWEDLKFDLKHFNDIELLAVVGDKQWEKWMTFFCKPFTTAEVRYFDAGEYDQAKDWIEHGEKTKVNTGTGVESTPF